MSPLKIALPSSRGLEIEFAVDFPRRLERDAGGTGDVQIVPIEFNFKDTIRNSARGLKDFFHLLHGQLFFVVKGGKPLRSGNETAGDGSSKRKRTAAG
jgi:hypothetical protein